MKRGFLRNKRQRALLAFGLVSLSLGFSGCENFGARWAGSVFQDHATELSLRNGRVERGDLEVRVTASGQVQSKRRTSINAPYAGFVQKLFVSLGETVKAGQPLVRVGESSEGASVLASFPMRAPFSGTVVELNVSEGQQVQANAGPDDLKTMMTIEDMSAFEAAIEIAELDVNLMKVGMAAKIKISALPDKIFTGRLTRLNLSAKRENSWSSSKVIFPAGVSFDEYDERLRPGMTALIDVIVNQRENVLLLGHEYIQGDASGYFVTTATGQKVDVSLGLQNETHAEITSGLKEGDEVRMVEFMNLGVSTN